MGAGGFCLLVIAAGGVSLLARPANQLAQAPEGVPPGLEDAPNVILIGADTLRADRLSCYGYGDSKTPNIDALAADGVLYSEMTAQASWTKPSFATIFTSLYPSSHTATGKPHRLPEDVRATLDQAIARTADNRDMRLNLALSYGGRTEITEMVQSIAHQVAAGKIQPSMIDESLVSDHLYTAGQPDPDLLIRTSGEMRISNFLLWQLAYAELFVTETLWPDFSRDEYLQILAHYQQRDRRFGKVQE